MAFLTTSIASYRTLPFKLLPPIRSSTFSNIEFYQLGSIRILVLITVAEVIPSFIITVQDVARLALGDYIVASFYSTFVKVIVDFDRYTDKIVQIFDFYAGSHKFILNVFLQATSVYSYQGGVILIGNLGILLEFRGIIGC